MRNGVVFVLYRNGGGVMEYRLRKDKPYYNQWLFPGGWIEEGEEPWHAMVREASEELGVECLEWDDVGSFESKDNGGMLIRVFIVTKWSYNGRYYAVPGVSLDYGNPIAWREISDVAIYGANEYDRKVATMISAYLISPVYNDIGIVITK